MKNNQLDINLTLSNEDIVALLDSVKTFFADSKMDKRSVMRLMLSLEESLLRWQDYFGIEQRIHAFNTRRFFRNNVVITLEGTQINPLLSIEEEYTDTISVLLSAKGVLPVYSYKQGFNRLTITPALENKFLLSIVLAAFLGIALGFLCGFLPMETQKSIVDSFLTPVFNFFLRLIKLIAMPLIFTSILSGIIFSSSDVKSKTSLRTLSVLFFLIPLSVVTLYSILLSHCLEFQTVTESSISSNAAVYIVKILSNFIPENLITPFVEGKMIQIAFISVVCGLLISSSGAEADHLKIMALQLDFIIKKAFNILLYAIIPFTTLCIINLMLKPRKGVSDKYIILIIVGMLFFLCVTCLCLIIYAIKTKKSPRSILSALKSTYLLIFITGSRWSAFEKILEGMQTLGISQVASRQAVSLGLVFCQPLMAGWHLTLLFFFAIFENIPVSAEWFFLATISIILMSYGNNTTTVIAILFPQLGISGEGIILIMLIESIMMKFRAVFEIICLTSLVGITIPPEGNNLEETAH